MCRPNRMMTTPAILPRSDRCSISTTPMAVAEAPSEMKTSEKPSTKASDMMTALRRDAGRRADGAPVPVPRISSSVTPDTKDR